MGRRAEHSQDQQRRMALDAARAIVVRDGLRALSVRSIAARMGYAAGTLYQLFADLDDLIIVMNCETLEALATAAGKVDLRGDPEDVLIRLADVYIRMVSREPKRWNAVFEYNPPAGRAMPERYQQAVGNLLALVQRVIDPLFRPGQEARRLHEARVMWSGLYGIMSLASSRKSSVEVDPSSMVQSLAKTYVAGIRALNSPGGKPTRKARQQR